MPQIWSLVLASTQQSPQVDPTEHYLTTISNLKQANLQWRESCDSPPESRVQNPPFTSPNQPSLCVSLLSSSRTLGKWLAGVETIAVTLNLLFQRHPKPSTLSNFTFSLKRHFYLRKLSGSVFPLQLLLPALLCKRNPFIQLTCFLY